MTTTEQKLAAARERLARAQRRAGVTGDRVGVPNDPGALSGTRRTSTPRQRHQDAAAIDRSVNASVEYVAALAAVEGLEAQRFSEQKNQAVRDSAVMEVPIDDLKPGDLIRYERHGSPRNAGRVVRVNAKTVTIDAPEPYDKPKIDKARIIATSRPAKKEPDDA